MHHAGEKLRHVWPGMSGELALSVGCNGGTFGVGERTFDGLCKCTTVFGRVHKATDCITYLLRSGARLGTTQMTPAACALTSIPDVVMARYGNTNMSHAAR